jgi:hypothetical protein
VLSMLDKMRDESDGATVRLVPELRTSKITRTSSSTCCSPRPASRPTSQSTW